MTCSGTQGGLGSPTSTPQCGAVLVLKRYLAAVRKVEHTKAHSFMLDAPDVRTAIDMKYAKVQAVEASDLPEYQLFEVLDKYKYILVSQKPVSVPSKSEEKRPPRWKIYYSYHDVQEVA